MKKIVSFCLFLCVGVCGVFAGGSSENKGTSQDGYVIKMGYSPGNMQPAESMEIMYGDSFKRNVEELTGGKIRVEIYASDALGTANDTLGAISVGSVEMGLFEIALFSTYLKDTMLFNLPGKFRSRDEATRAFNNEWAFRNVFDKLETNSKLKVIGGVCKGFRSFTANSGLKLPQDIKGLSIRVMDSAMYIRMVESLSANPVVIAGSEMYTAMQNGVVDGHENTILSVWQDKTYEVQKFMVMDQHIPSIMVWVMNTDFYNKLPSELQAAIIEANKRASEDSRKVVEDLNNMLMNNLRAAGLAIYEPNSREQQMWHDVYSGPCETLARSQIGNEPVDNFLNFLRQFRN
ncbi:MAG: TRAP transporter substrate-binding protein [Spirochaetales bacterium]|nr:TRAP transporter substrate-binding protein [Spirochaetales bacterium]